MLREIPNIRQHNQEAHRRWFHCAEQDLYLWQASNNGNIIAFQLCYGKPDRQHALYWRLDQGFAHLEVDDGETGYGNQTPILISDGVFPADAALQRFLALAAELPDDIVAFIQEKIAHYPSDRNPA